MRLRALPPFRTTRSIRKSSENIAVIAIRRIVAKSIGRRIRFSTNGESERGRGCAKKKKEAEG